MSNETCNYLPLYCNPAAAYREQTVTDISNANCIPFHRLLDWE